MHRNKSVDVHQFAMVPKSEVPRSTFMRQFTHKTTFDAGYLIPIYVDEVLPGDTFNMSATMFARMSTPIYPLMDNMYIDSFFFFVPNRLVWENWVHFMGEKDNPGDSTTYTVPVQESPAGGYAANSLQDYMGLPTDGQVDNAETVTHSALWLRAYNLIYNEWFRDQNLIDSVVVDKDDGPDDPTDYVLLRRGKRHDYFTSALPWVQKGTAVTLPLGTSAPVKAFNQTDGLDMLLIGQASPQRALYNYSDQTTIVLGGSNPTGQFPITIDNASAGAAGGMYADLSTATAATINQIRQAFQIQKLLERDARGGTRYTELVRAHFGVQSPDARLQRPEYLGGGTTPVNIHPIAQTSATGLTGGSTPLGNISAFGTALASNHGFTASFTEHGVIIGLACVRADLTYQQGLHRMWSRSTRYDFYWPAFAMLGEQAVLNKEIYCTGIAADDDEVFGYQERWAEYRYKPSMITGLFKSTTANAIDGWHLSQEFGSLPELNQTFIEENPPMERILAVGAGAAGKHFIFDGFFNNKVARPMPLYSVPGLIDHF